MKALLRTLTCAGGALALAASAASATPVQLTSFDNFSLDATYANWGAPFTTITSAADRFIISSMGYGSGYKYLGGEFNANGNDTVQLKATVSSGVAGMLVDLVDANNNGVAFRFYGLTPGNGDNGTNDYTLQMPLSAGQYFTGSGVLDTTRISQMNIEIDPGGGAVSYTASFNDLSLVTVPEPTSLALIGGAAAFPLVGARRRRHQ
jgi:hypothetical protein